MNIFKTYTFTWRQMGIFKIAMLAFGVAVGAYWHEAFTPYIAALIVVALAAGVYIAIVSGR